MPKKNENDTILRITAMVASLFVLAIGGFLGLGVQIQFISLGFLLIIASGTDPKIFIELWKRGKK